VNGSENKTDKTFYEGSRGLKPSYGYARFDVWNNATTKVRDYRNNGIGEQFLFTNERFPPQAMPNYDLGDPNSTHFFLSF
jgi:hypothetical protein